MISRGADKSHYPWPYNFSRNMPWEEEGFDNWKLKNGYEND
ncbi:hypothetical protein [Chryseobacterium sp. W4I1]|nr:hypothetical protein [Chryseobacterium sp. W4I1]MDQ0784210.1 hypothetical protein [Chryseobacterium sp. W4I1]